MRFGLLQTTFTVSALVLAASASISPTLAEEPAANALRLCADPSNLPFSSDDSARPGVYVEIGDAIGKALGRPVVHVWYRTYFGKHAVRVTMLADQCDLTIGLPASDDFMGPRVIFSKPLFQLGYAIVTPKDARVAGVADLKGKRIAVQFATEPHNVVGPRDDMTAVTVLSPEEGMKALAEGRADAAFLWAPTAGYLNKTAYDERFNIVPVEGHALTYPAAIGYPKASGELRDSIDAVLPEISKRFPALLAKYGLSFNPPATHGDPPATHGSADPPAVVEKAAFVVAQTASPPSAAQAAPSPAETANVNADARDPGKPAGNGSGEFDVAPLAPNATSELIAQGKEVFNGTCAHCHGPDAVQGEKRIDLRRLTLRYHDGAHNMYWKTVHEGRPSKGMPTWKGVFTDDQFTQIWAFLSSVQTQE